MENTAYISSLSLLGQINLNNKLRFLQHYRFVLCDLHLPVFIKTPQAHTKYLEDKEWRSGSFYE